MSKSYKLPFCSSCGKGPLPNIELALGFTLCATCRDKQAGTQHIPKPVILYRCDKYGNRIEKGDQ